MVTLAQAVNEAVGMVGLRERGNDEHHPHHDHTDTTA